MRNRRRVEAETAEASPGVTAGHKCDCPARGPGGPISPGRARGEEHGSGQRGHSGDGMQLLLDGVSPEKAVHQLDPQHGGAVGGKRPEHGPLVATVKTPHAIRSQNVAQRFRHTATGENRTWV